MKDGGYNDLNYGAFSDVLADPLSGLSWYKEAEKRLLSYHVVRSLERHGSAFS